MRSQIATGRFRWRLVVAFVLVSGISAGTLAIGSYLLVSKARNDTFRDRALRDSHTNYALVISALESSTLESNDEESLRSMVFRLKRQSGAEIVAVTPGEVVASDSNLGVEEVPRDLARVTDDGSELDLASGEISTDDGDFLVVTSGAPLDELDLYFFYSKAALDQSMKDLALIMLRLWAILVAASALVGNALARRTLHPVARAGEAARRLAEGLLDTRLPVDSRDEFGAWAASFNEMADALQEKISELTQARERERQFTSDVAHELRTPLTALVSSASMLDARLDQMEHEPRWAAEKMIAEVRRLRGLVEELMEISKLHAGRESIRSEPVEIGHLVRSVVSTRKWDGLVTMEGYPVKIVTDRRRLERIVANLISNAVRHGQKEVRTRTGSRDGTAFIQVSDEGPGIAPEYVDNIFDRFYKVDPARPGGSGLGLSIAAENARLLGGNIEVDTEPGQGARFVVQVPLEPLQSSFGRTSVA